LPLFNVKEECWVHGQLSRLIASPSRGACAIKRATDTIAGGDIDAAREAVRAAISTLDRAAQKGVLHPNNAARRKSRLLLRYNASVAALQTPTEERPAGKEKPARSKTSASKTTKTGKTAKRAPAKKAKK
jgi:ribosomal protein S20